MVRENLQSRVFLAGYSNEYIDVISGNWAIGTRAKVFERFLRRDEPGFYSNMEQNVTDERETDQNFRQEVEPIVELNNIIEEKCTQAMEPSAEMKNTLEHNARINVERNKDTDIDVHQDKGVIVEQNTKNNINTVSCSLESEITVEDNDVKLSQKNNNEEAGGSENYNSIINCIDDAHQLKTNVLIKRFENYERDMHAANIDTNVKRRKLIIDESFSARLNAIVEDFLRNMHELYNDN
ncbi:hypothetical protein COBT_002821 [Conglomerata obtusa]